MLVEKKMRWPLGGNFELPTWFITVYILCIFSTFLKVINKDYLLCRIVCEKNSPSHSRCKNKEQCVFAKFPSQEAKNKLLIRQVIVKILVVNPVQKEQRSKSIVKTIEKSGNSFPNLKDGLWKAEM
jgi:hypothetical protein